jgi:hypothetical protein
MKLKSQRYNVRTRHVIEEQKDDGKPNVNPLQNSISGSRSRDISDLRQPARGDGIDGKSHPPMGLLC